MYGYEKAHRLGWTEERYLLTRKTIEVLMTHALPPRKCCLCQQSTVNLLLVNDGIGAIGDLRLRGRDCFECRMRRRLGCVA